MVSPRERRKKKYLWSEPELRPLLANLSRAPPAWESARRSPLGSFKYLRSRNKGFLLPPPRPRRAIRGDFLPLETPQAGGLGKFFKSPNPPVPPSVVVFSPLELRALGLVQLKNSAPLSKSTFPALPPPAPSASGGRPTGASLAREGPFPGP